MSGSPRNEQVTSRPLRALEGAALVPAVAAFVIGALYAVGTTVRGARLAEADVKIPEALPLIPLEQLLAEGVSVALQALVPLAILGIALMLLVIVGRRVTPPRSSLWTPTRDRPAPLASLRVVVAMQGILAVLAVIVALNARPAGGVAMLLVGAIGMYGVRRMARADSRRARQSLLTKLAIVGYVITSAAAIGERIAVPVPLPSVTVNLIRGPPIHGELIASTGTVLYVKIMGNQIAIVPNQRIAQARIRSRERNRTRPMHQLVRDVISSR